MHSSEAATRARHALAVALALGLFGCAAAPSAPLMSAGSAGAVCASSSGDTKLASPGVQEVLRSVEASPLFATAIAPGGVASCTVAIEAGQAAISYESRNGNRLVVRRSEQIESTAQEAWLRTSPAEPPVAILTRAERAAFGAQGCGIAWDRPEAGRAPVTAQGAVSIYRGDVCNCQASVERDPSGRVVAMALKSAC